MPCRVRGLPTPVSVVISFLLQSPLLMISPFLLSGSLVRPIVPCDGFQLQLSLSSAPLNTHLLTFYFPSATSYLFACEGFFIPALIALLNNLIPVFSPSVVSAKNPPPTPDRPGAVSTIFFPTGVLVLHLATFTFECCIYDVFSPPLWLTILFYSVLDERIGI